MALLKSFLKASTIKIKRIGDNGHPFLCPLEILKNFDGQPLIIGEIQGPHIQEEIHARKSAPKPNLVRTAKRMLCLTLSKALAISSLMAIPLSPCSLLEWMVSLTIRMLSIIYCFSTKPPWWGEINLCRWGLILMEIIFEMSL